MTETTETNDTKETGFAAKVASLREEDIITYMKNELQPCDALCLARRYHNAKRSYLLVNRFQAKHMPARPKAALGMMRALGEKIRDAFPETGLIIAFAETATAIGLVAAEVVGGGCRCLTTTREEVAGVTDWVEFREEHSHATEQKLDGAALLAALSTAKTLVFLDDELSTGKTIRNMAQALRARFPEVAEKRIVAASIFYRLTEEEEAEMTALGITPVCLLRLPPCDYEDLAQKYEVAPATVPQLQEAAAEELRLTAPVRGNPRTGVVASAYLQQWRTFAWKALFSVLKTRAMPPARVLVLGTEECMLPAILIARAWEAAGYDTRCHATTRSPIGVASEAGYPIQEGWQLPSFYDEARTTYVYNLDHYDLVVVVTDAPCLYPQAEAALRGALAAHDCGPIVWICAEEPKERKTRKTQKETERRV